MILFRTDGNSIIGMGHIMRCMSIAASFKESGQNVLFITADHNADQILIDNGFECDCLDSLWSDMASELSVLKNKLNIYKPELMIIDSYSVNSVYFDALSECIKTVYIDDLNENHWDVDALINYNIYADQVFYANYSKSHTKLFLGHGFVPLRKEFSGCIAHIVNPVSKVLVLAGGSDPERITERIIQSVCPQFKNIEFHFVIGGLNPRKEGIYHLTEQYSNAVLHHDIRNMSELMMMSDAAISAAGSTLYELCACGVPTIAYALADNQLRALDAFGQKALVLAAGDCRNNENFISQLQECLLVMINDERLRSDYSKKMQSLVDGEGSARIVERLRSMYE